MKATGISSSWKDTEEPEIKWTPGHEGLKSFGFMMIEWLYDFIPQ